MIHETNSAVLLVEGVSISLISAFYPAVPYIIKA